MRSEMKTVQKLILPWRINLEEWNTLPPLSQLYSWWQRGDEQDSWDKRRPQQISWTTECREDQPVGPGIDPEPDFDPGWNISSHTLASTQDSPSAKQGQVSTQVQNTDLKLMLYV